MPTPSTENDGPRFEVMYPAIGADNLVRRNAAPDDVAAALFVNGVRRSFAGAVMTLNRMLIREGEWVTKDPVTGLIVKAGPTIPMAWPVWQDPGAPDGGRSDSADGGLTHLQGVWTVATNVINDGFLSAGISGLSPGDELKVGVMQVGHPFAGLSGLVPVNDEATGTFFVLAHVEEVRADGIAVISNAQAHYFKTVTQVLTTLAPTTPAPTTPAPTT